MGAGGSYCGPRTALRLLRTAGLVQNRRAGRLIYYRLVDGYMAELLELFRRQIWLDADGDAEG